MRFCASHSNDLPIFHAQPRYAAEFTGVVGNQGGIVGAGDGGDQGVVGADGLALGQQVGADLPVVLSALIIKRQALQWGEKGFEQLQIGFDPLAAPRAIQQFRLDHAAQRNVGGDMLAEVLQYERVFCVKQVDADVGVEQVNYLIFRRSSKGTDGGRSSGAPSHFPKMSK